MFLKQLDLTTALRPAYLPDEVLLFVQDNVGLYEGKCKLPNQQNGQVYLTSHRICYVDKAEPRKYSVALDLKAVERYEFYAGFLKSSAKITLVPKVSKRSSLQSRSSTFASVPSRTGSGSPAPRSEGPRTPLPELAPVNNATWVCTICSFSNPVPSNFDPATATAHTSLPPCLACGIKPTLAHVLKASISNATSRPSGPVIQAPLPIRPSPSLAVTALANAQAAPSSLALQSSDPDASFQCPRCTFLNHPSLLSCEICGASLITHDTSSDAQGQRGIRSETDSPGPVLNTPLSGMLQGVDNPESVKLSFRASGEKIFYERLKGAMTQRKWLLHEAPPIPKVNRDSSSGNGTVGSAASGDRVKVAGIAGLESRGHAMRKNNELVIGSAFEDLEALMASAKEIVALAENFTRHASSGENALLAQSASQLGLMTTKDIVGNGDESLYISELARNLAEFLTDDVRGVLKRAGGIVSLVDLWAIFNRARGGVELVSPMDFHKAANMWEELKLPVRLRTFKSGVMVVQGRDRTDEVTIRALKTWLADLQATPPEHAVAWDWAAFGRGVTIQDVAERFGWSIGVAEEELEMAEQRGVLCREEGIEGVRFWQNYIDTGEGKLYKDAAVEESERIARLLKESGFL